MTQLEYTEQGWRSTPEDGRHHRESLWNYKGRAVYHITLAVEQRYHLFGELAGNSEDDAFIELSEMGQYVKKTFRGLPDFFLQKGCDIRILQMRIMPDHLHIVLHVRQPMSKSIGEVIRSAKSACTSHYKRTYLPQPTALGNQPTAPGNQPLLKNEQGLPTAPSLAQPTAQGLAQPTAQGDVCGKHFCRIFATRGSIWEYMRAGYHERILHCDGQLDRMIAYVRDNPRRLWLKHHNPQFFRLRKGVILDSQQGRWECRAMGNMFLISFPFRQQVQCSRSLSQSEIDARKAVVLRLAAQGYVTISAAISEGEKQIVRAVREAGHPLVILLKDGFPAKDSPHERYYKPSGIYFDACAEGRLLLLEPLDSVYASPAIANAVYRKSPFAPRNSQRYRFLALNTIANALSNEEVRVTVEQQV